MRLEEHDELGLPWDEWADGRVHRLVKGRDFLRSAEAAKAAAANAASRLGKVAVSVVEGRGRNVFLWVQFVDSQVVLGDPCPCGSTDLRRATRRFAVCGRCDATLLIVEPRLETRGGGAEAGHDPLLNTLLGRGARADDGERGARASDAAAGSQARQALRDPRMDVRHLGAYREIALTLHERAAGRERFYGRGIGPRGRDWLMVVDFALVDGEWVASQDPGGWSHAVWGMPLEHLDDLLDHEELASLSQDLVINDPFEDDYAGREAADRSMVGRAELRLPPLGVEDLSHVRLHDYKLPHTPEIERYRGIGCLPDGEDLLLAVRFRLRDGQRFEDPRIRGRLAQDLKALPLMPFSGLVDVTSLVDVEPKVRIESGAEVHIDAAQAS